jgi:hypothetical protein
MNALGPGQRRHHENPNRRTDYRLCANVRDAPKLDRLMGPGVSNLRQFDSSMSNGDQTPADQGLCQPARL